MTTSLQDKWEEMPAKSKQMVVVAGAVVLFLILIVPMLASEAEKEAPKRSHIVRNILIDGDLREMGIDGLAAQIKSLRQGNSDLSREINGIKQNRHAETLLEELRKEIHSEREQILILKQDLAAASKKVDGADKRAEQAALKAIQKVKEQLGVDIKRFDEKNKKSKKGYNSKGLDSFKKPDETNNSDNLFEPPEENDTSDRRGGSTKPAVKSEPLKIRIIDQSTNSGEEGSSNKTARRKEEAEKKEKKEEWSVYIPPGTIISGILMTGMDAPTGKQSKGDPYPILLRVKQDAILPNRFKADLKECFIVAAGYGEISSERAYVRGETISCIRSDGKVVEARLDAYAVGEDGKVGIRGRLVSKQGALIGRSLIAGLMEGVAEAFKKSSVPVIANQVADDGKTPFQSSFSADGMQSAALNGMSSAMQRVADFYVDMAENIFPIIEIDPGRRIEFIVHRGGRLGAKGGTEMGMPLPEKREPRGNSYSSSRNSNMSGKNNRNQNEALNKLLAQQ